MKQKKKVLEVLEFLEVLEEVDEEKVLEGLEVVDEEEEIKGSKSPVSDWRCPDVFILVRFWLTDLNWCWQNELRKWRRKVESESESESEYQTMSN